MNLCFRLGLRRRSWYDLRVHQSGHTGRRRARAFADRWRRLTSDGAWLPPPSSQRQRPRARRSRRRDTTVTDRRRAPLLTNPPTVPLIRVDDRSAGHREIKPSGPCCCCSVQLIFFIRDTVRPMCDFSGLSSWDASEWCSLFVCDVRASNGADGRPSTARRIAEQQFERDPWLTATSPRTAGTSSVSSLWFSSATVVTTTRPPDKRLASASKVCSCASRLAAVPAQQPFRRRRCCCFFCLHFGFSRFLCPTMLKLLSRFSAHIRYPSSELLGHSEDHLTEVSYRYLQVFVHVW